jgi:hypothetical protein
MDSRLFPHAGLLGKLVLAPMTIFCSFQLLRVLKRGLLFDERRGVTPPGWSVGLLLVLAITVVLGFMSPRDP